MTLEQIKSRHSVRAYSPETIPMNLRNALNAQVTMINSHEPGLNFQIVYDDDDPFKGVSRSYGFFHDTHNYLACVIDPSFPDTEERAGYFAEQFVMKAMELGLGTCFVGGTFSASHVKVQMHVYEKLPFIVAFGVPMENKTPALARFAMKIAHRKKMAPRDFFEGDETAYKEAIGLYPWLPDALTALACAPSSLNKRPVRISYREGRLYARSLPADKKSAIDLGIGKFNFSAVAPGEWEWGEDAPFIYEDQV